MKALSNSQQYELISHHTFEIKTKQTLSDSYLTTVKQTIAQTLRSTWFAMKQLDNVTVRIDIETTECTETLSTIITDIIQNHS